MMPDKQELARQKTPVARSLARMMALIPILHANQGIELQKLRKVASYKRPAELRRDLDRLMLMGVPPFGPDDFLDIDIEDDRVYLHFPQGLEQPLNLTDSEWILLLNLVKQALAFPDEESDETVLQELVQKIAPVPLTLASADLENYKTELVQEAIREKQPITFGYLSVASREIERRRLDPWQVFVHRGNAYVIGFCHTRQAPRNFHLDRMENIEMLDEDQIQERPENIKDILSASPIFGKHPAGFTVKLAYDPDARAALELQLQLSAIEPAPAGLAPANWMQGLARVDSRSWLLQRLRSYGSTIKILEPAFLAQEFAQTIKDTPLPTELA